MDTGQHRRFQAADYAVFAAMLIISAGIGVYHRLTGGRQRTVGEYLLADRKMGVLPVAFSLMASFMSAITILGVAAENYSFGTQFFLINVAYIFGTPIAAFVYLPVFFRMQATSAYEYLERRFGRVSRMTTSAIFQLQMVVYMGVVLYAPALALSAVSGISKWTSVISLGLVCTFYSTIGGMKAVLWTDVFQSVLMFAAIFAVLIKGFVDVESLSDFFKVVNEGKRFEFFRVDLDPTVRHTVWTQFIGGMFTFLTLFGVNQAQIQRLLTIGDLKKSQMSLFVSWPILAVLSLATTTCGLVIYYKYHDCDPLISGRISSSDQLMPLFVIDYLSEYPGVAGLFVSGVFSATLSTVSSAVNSLAAVTLEDFLKPCFNFTQTWSDDKQAFASKVLVLLYGVICLVLTYVAEQLGGVLQASLTIFGVVGGPLLGLFSLGMFTVKSNQKGAIFGFISALLLVGWIGFGAHFSNVKVAKLPLSVSGCSTSFNQSESSSFMSSAHNLTESVTSVMLHNNQIWFVYRISYMWLAPIGSIWVFLVGYFVSVLTGGNDGDIDSTLISPPFHRICGLNEIKDNKMFVLPDGELRSLHDLQLPSEKSEECATQF